MERLKESHTMPSFVEPLVVGVVVSLINKYVLPLLPGPSLLGQCAQAPTECAKEDECMSSSSSAVTADVVGTHHHIHF